MKTHFSSASFPDFQNSIRELGYKRHVGVNGGRWNRIGLITRGIWNQVIVQSFATA